MKHKNYKSEKEGNVNDKKSNICYEIKKLTQKKNPRKLWLPRAERRKRAIGGRGSRGSRWRLASLVAVKT